jgi:hypothetical protein
MVVRADSVGDMRGGNLEAEFGVHMKNKIWSTSLIRCSQVVGKVAIEAVQPHI